MGICRTPAGGSEPVPRKYNGCKLVIGCADCGPYGGTSARHDDGVSADLDRDSGAGRKAICESGNSVAAAGPFGGSNQVSIVHIPRAEAGKCTYQTGIKTRRSRGFHDVEPLWS